MGVIIRVSGDKATIKGKDIGIDLSGKEYWEKHSILLDWVEEQKLDACIVPYDCEGGCAIIACYHNIGTMGG